MIQLIEPPKKVRWWAKRLQPQHALLRRVNFLEFLPGRFSRASDVPESPSRCTARTYVPDLRCANNPPA